jgi:hypothetical protein
MKDEQPSAAPEAREFVLAAAATLRSAAAGRGDPG